MQFQSVWGVAPTESGIQLLLFIFFFPVGSAFWCNDGETGRYKPFHLAGFMFCTLSFGFCSILDRYTYKAVYVFFDIFDAFGIGIPMACLLPPVQAPLKDGDTARQHSYVFIHPQLYLYLGVSHSSCFI